MARKPLITFQGWDGKWWRKIKVGRGVYEAVTWVVPWKIGLVMAIAPELGKVVGRGLVRKRFQGR